MVGQKLPLKAVQIALFEDFVKIFFFTPWVANV